MWNNITYNLSWHKCWDHLIRMFAQDTYDILAHLSDPDSSGSLQVAMANPLWDLSEMGNRKITSVPVLFFPRRTVLILYSWSLPDHSLVSLTVHGTMCDHVHTCSNTHIHLHICLLYICPYALSVLFRGTWIINMLHCNELDLIY